MKLAILIPVLGRHHLLASLIESIEQSTEAKFSVYFITSPDDKGVTPAIKKIKTEASLHQLGMQQPAGPGDFARKINHAFDQTTEPWLFQAATDLVFQPGWDTEAFKAQDRYHTGVIGTNDLGNPLVIRGNHSTHTMFSRDYIEQYGGTYDGTGRVFSELYDHQFCDTEFIQTAIRRRQFGFARRAIVEHMHPHWNKAEMDATYEKATRATKEDAELYKNRMRQMRHRL